MTRSPPHGGWAWLLLACLALACSALAEEQHLSHASRLVSAEQTQPASSADWQPVSLPDVWGRRGDGKATAAWYRMTFAVPQISGARDPYAIYLPHLSGGGRFWLNGAPIATILESTVETQVRWLSPHLVVLEPESLLTGTNVLVVRAGLPVTHAEVIFPRLAVGPLPDVRAAYDRRYFVVKTLLYVSATACLLGAVFMLGIWAAKRSEWMYGLFGLAAMCWGLRVLTFTFEVVPAPWWMWLRLVFYSVTAGFVVAIAMLALRFDGRRNSHLELGLFAYALLGPLAFLASGFTIERLLLQLWLPGFLLFGVAVLPWALWTYRRERSAEAMGLALIMLLTLGAGIHDYLLNWNIGLLRAIFGNWADQRIFLLLHAANLSLLIMGVALGRRFIRALGALEDLNANLEAKLAARELQLAENFERLALLERQNAAAYERHLIMRDIHDGLGSQLFASLSKAERGALGNQETVETLRKCIAEMRVAINTLSPGEKDFRSTLGDFMFRWRSQLEGVGLVSAWNIDVPDEELAISPHATLAILRIAQEALTNAMKHSAARRVAVHFRRVDDDLLLEVQDDGHGILAHAHAHAGQGMKNMRSRAEQLGAELEVDSSVNGTRIRMRVSVKRVGVPDRKVRVTGEHAFDAIS